MEGRRDLVSHWRETLGCSPGHPVPAHPYLKLSGQEAIPIGQHTQHTHMHAQGELIPKELTGSMGPALNPQPLPAHLPASLRDHPDSGASYFKEHILCGQAALLACDLGHVA